MAGEKVLVVDDEVKIARVLRAYLEKDGFTVLESYDGRSALDMARTEKPDMVILDLMLPELSGWDVCRALRSESAVPVLMLTAMDDDTDKIVGLELGADDYVTKPFNPREVVARVRAILRRGGAREPVASALGVGDLKIDVAQRSVWVGKSEIHLTPTEFDLLATLAEHPGRVYSRTQLMERVLGGASEGYERAIDSHVKNLRQKVEPDPRNPRYVLTSFGVGYKLSPE